MLVGLDESVLDHVERVVLVTHHPERERVRTAVIALVQRAERVAIAASRRLHEIGVVNVRIASMCGVDAR